MANDIIQQQLQPLAVFHPNCLGSIWEKPELWKPLDLLHPHDLLCPPNRGCMSDSCGAVAKFLPKNQGAVALTMSN